MDVKYFAFLCSNDSSTLPEIVSSMTICMPFKASPTLATGKLQCIGFTNPECAKLVYYRCMARTNINIDDQACAAVMRRYGLTTKREAVNFALRMLAAEQMSVDEARNLRGSGWECDLTQIRHNRTN